VAPVNDMADLDAEPQWPCAALGSRPPPVIGTYQAVGPPLLPRRRPRSRPDPLPGQHNREVFCGLLGLGEKEYMEYMRKEREGALE